MSVLLRKVAARLGLLLMGLLITFALLEGITRLLWSPSGFQADIRSFSAACLEADPVRGHRIRPGCSVEVGGVQYRFSSFGTRGPEPAPRRESEPSAFRILVLGDSVSLGWGVAEESTWPARLSALLEVPGRKVEIVNASVIGYGTQQEMSWLPGLLSALRPDLVLVGYYPNDPEGLDRARGLPGPRWSRFWQWVAPRLRVLAVRLGLRDGATDHHRRLHEPDGAPWRRTERALAGMAAVVHGQRHPPDLGLVLLPELSVWPYPLQEVHRQVAEAARRRGFTVLDLAPSLEGADLRSLWVAPDDAHPNAGGHALYAERIASWLSERYKKQ